MIDSKKILVTGGAGFIGKNILERLGGQFKIIAPKRDELDLLNAAQTADFFKNQHFDVVIHAAGLGISRAQANTPAVFKNNTEMFLNLAQSRSGFDRLITFGSGAEYDKSRSLHLVRESQFGESKPKDEYGLAKYLISEEIQKTQNIINLRCFGVFGKYEDYATRFISNSICRSLAGMPIVIRRNTVFDYLYVNDLIRIVAYFIDHEPKEKFYNACRGEGVELLFLAGLVKEVTGSQLEIKIKETGMSPEYSGNNTLLMAEMGKFEFTPLKNAIEEMVIWYKANWEKIDKNSLNFDA